MQLHKIISGGQTGADMGGLLAAKELDLETGGTAPKNFMTEESSNWELKTIYGLVARGNYAQRTYHNVNNSDATVVFGDITTPGTKLTIRLCNELMKPLRINPPTKSLLVFLEDHQIQVLNVAGNRESKDPGIEERVKEFLVEALS